MESRGRQEGFIKNYLYSPSLNLSSHSCHCEVNLFAAAIHNKNKLAMSSSDLIRWRTANNPVNCWLTTAKTCWRERKRKRTEASLTSRVTDGRKKKQLTLLFLRRRNETFCCELVKRRETTNLVGIGCCRALSETYAARHPGQEKTSQPQAVSKFTSLSREVARKGG